MIRALVASDGGMVVTRDLILAASSGGRHGVFVNNVVDQEYESRTTRKRRSKNNARHRWWRECKAIHWHTCSLIDGRRKQP